MTSTAPRIPRDKEADYTPDVAERRREFLHEQTGVNLEHVGSFSFDPTLTVVGPVTLSFTGYETATMSALGTTLDLQRFDLSDTNLFNPATLYGFGRSL